MRARVQLFLVLRSFDKLRMERRFQRLLRMREKDATARLIRSHRAIRAHPEKCETVFGKDARQSKELEPNLIHSDRNAL
ncbi:hypothetical protein BSU07_01690 [Brucella melitensis]|nr:hypothetical protein BSU07_01690 [Brucella melitensis]PAO84544.1 hypothetical protein CJU93_01290 [Brucella melitensis]